MPTLLGTARTTGLLYLGLALTGLVGFLLLRPEVFTDDPAETVARIVDREGTARLVVALELAIVLTQALVAVWFFRLFRHVDSFVAGVLAAFGLLNAAVLLGSAASLGAAVDIALDPAGSGAAEVDVLLRLSEHLWQVGGLFFGAWLLPMGWLAYRSGMPRALAGILLVGGVGYVAGAFVGYLADAGAFVDLAALPATVGEVWIVGYLLHGGIFRPEHAGGTRVNERLSGATADT